MATTAGTDGICPSKISSEDSVTTASLRLNDNTEIPLVGLGVYQTEPGEETYTACLSALKAGYRHIDSASLYDNETAVGRAVKDSNIPREEIYITTKLWALSYNKGEDPYDFAKREAKESMERLGTYIDLYLIHSPHHKKERLEFWRAMIDLQKEGKVKSIGVSNFGKHHIDEFVENSAVIPSVNQIELHPFLTQESIVSHCAKHKIAIEAYSPLARAEHMDDEVLNGIAKRLGKSVAQVMIRWSLQKGYITLPKSSKPTRIIENSIVFDFELSQDDMKLIASLSKYVDHTGWDPTTLA